MTTEHKETTEIAKNKDTRTIKEYLNGEEFAEDAGSKRQGQREQQRNRTRAALLGPQPHRNRGHQEEVQPWQIAEEGL